MLISLIIPTIYAQIDPLFTRCAYSSNNYCIQGNDFGIVHHETPNIPHDVIAAWNFNQMYYLDQSGHFYNLHPAYEGGPDVIARGEGGSLILSNHTLTTQDRSLDLSIDWSLSFWLFIAKVENTKHVLSVGDTFQLMVRGVNETKFNLLVTSDTLKTPCTIKNVVLSTPFPIRTRRWHHIAVSFERERSLLFLNKIKVGSTTSVLHPNDILRIGKIRSCDSASGFLDDLMFYGKPLTEMSVRMVGPQNRLPPIPELKFMGEQLGYDFKGADISATEVGGVCLMEGWELCSTAQIDSMHAVLSILIGLNHRDVIWRGDLLSKEDETGVAICCKKGSELAKTPKDCIS